MSVAYQKRLKKKKTQMPPSPLHRLARFHLSLFKKVTFYFSSLCVFYFKRTAFPECPTLATLEWCGRVHAKIAHLHLQFPFKQ